ncbi:MAG: hypothetical protein AB8B52_08185 [Winogradskyella sp.]|uniref:hypothetical protein n=1 Tax=Winogradskyella sp. TaxID=1883156 RepID=UPI00385F7468
MATQGERQNFNWRPNTNDSTNLTRFSQEAQLWVNAVESAKRKNKRSSFSGNVGTIGLLISLVFSLLTLVVLCVINFIKWLRA